MTQRTTERSAPTNARAKEATLWTAMTSLAGARVPSTGLAPAVQKTSMSVTRQTPAEQTQTRCAGILQVDFLATALVATRDHRLETTVQVREKLVNRR